MIKNFIAEQKQLRAQQFNPGLTVTSFTAFVFEGKLMSVTVFVTVCKYIVYLWIFLYRNGWVSVQSLSEWRNLCGWRLQFHLRVPYFSCWTTMWRYWSVQFRGLFTNLCLIFRSLFFFYFLGCMLHEGYTGSHSFWTLLGRKWLLHQRSKTSLLDEMLEGRLLMFLECSLVKLGCSCFAGRQNNLQ